MPPPHQRLRTAQCVSAYIRTCRLRRRTEVARCEYSEYHSTGSECVSAYLPAPVVPNACKGLSVRLGSAAALLGLTSLFVCLVPALYAMPVPAAAAGVAGRCSKTDRPGFSMSEQCHWSVCTVAVSRQVSQPTGVAASLSTGVADYLRNLDCARRTNGLRRSEGRVSAALNRR
jgi:hypothetical protein